MNITEAKYFTDSDANNEWVRVTVDGEHRFVPLDPANRHYAAILEWVADGNTIQDAS